MIFNKDPDTRKLEEEAFKIDPKEAEKINDYYYSDFNKRTRDINIFCYEYLLQEIIEKGRSKQ